MLTVNCVWMVSIVIHVIALRVTLENAVCLVGGRFDLMNNNMNNSNQHIYVACIILKFAIKTIAFQGLKE